MIANFAPVSVFDALSPSIKIVATDGMVVGTTGSRLAESGLTVVENQLAELWLQHYKACTWFSQAAR